MKIELGTDLPCSYEEALARVNTPGLLQQVAAPMVAFTPVEPARFPAAWSPGRYTVKLTLFGVIPFGRQDIVISYPNVGQDFALRDNGRSALIREWDHTIRIARTAGGVRYTDSVAISAGLLTPFVWVFALVFYRHRQRRWRRLATRGFDAAVQE